MLVRSYSPIAPIKVLRQLQEEGILGNYLLLLAHDVLEHPREYANLVRPLLRQDDSFIIMDNGVVELGEPMPSHKVLAAADLVSASCIVSPDVIGDFYGTKKLAIRDIPYFLDERVEVMAIPQGRCIGEIGAYINWVYERFPSIHLWGIPRWFATKLGTRQHAIDHINVLQSDRARIHLLGMSDKLGDDLKCLGMKNVMGIDSANPLVIGRNGLHMSSHDYYHASRGDYWDDPVLCWMSKENVKWMHSEAFKASQPR